MAIRTISAGPGRVKPKEEVPYPGMTTNRPQAQVPVPRPYQPSTNQAPQPLKPNTTVTGNVPYPGMAKTTTTAAAPAPKTSVPMPPQTNYGGKSNPYNELLYSKRQYDEGNKGWAQNNATQYYDKLDPTERTKVQGMNAMQLEDYINSMNKRGVEDTTTDTTGQAPAPSPVPMPSTEPTFTAPTPTNDVPIYEPALPVRDEAAIRRYAEEQTAKRLAELGLYSQQQIRAGETTANQQLQGLQTAYDRQRETITEDRGVANVENARNLNPFSGRSDYALGQIERERGRTDREMQQDHLSRQGNVNQDLSNLRNTINEKYAQMQNMAPQEAEAMYQSILNDERNYDLAINGQQIEGLMANSQLNNTSFNQALAGYSANRQAWEGNRAYDYGTYKDMVDWTGFVPNAQGLAGTNSTGLSGAQGANPFTGSGGGIRTLQGSAMDLQNKQANLGAALDYSNLTGRVLSPQEDWSGLPRQAASGQAPRTLAGQQQDYSQRADIRDYNRGTLESDRNYNRGVFEGDRNYDRGVTESDRNYGLQEEQLFMDYIDSENSTSGTAANTVTPTSAGQMLGNSLTKIVGYNDNNQPVYQKYNDPATREKAFVEAWNASGIAAGTDTIEMLSKAGYTSAEIESYKKKYPQAFNGGSGGGDFKTSKGFHSSAEDAAKQFGLTKTSGYRSPEKNAAVGGSKNSSHLTGNASDFAGTAAQMKAYAEWATKSGLFKSVIYGGKDWISGRVDKNHDDHVHLGWG